MCLEQPETPGAICAASNSSGSEVYDGPKVAITKVFATCQRTLYARCPGACRQAGPPRCLGFHRHRLAEAARSQWRQIADHLRSRVKKMTEWAVQRARYMT